jgi:hypothetical protein
MLRATSLALAAGLVGGAAGASPLAPRSAPATPRLTFAAAPSIITPATAAQLATARGVPPADLLAADLMGSDPDGVGVSDASLGEWFPTDGGTFAILATGLAADASLPDDSGNHSTTLGDLNNNAGRDFVRLHLQLNVPADVNCVTFDFAYYSEEFPEYVGSQFNDAFTAQLNDPTNVVSGTVVTAPGNFALDTLGNQISVNTVFGVTGPTGTTYDGVTPLLRASTGVTPSATVDLYFSIQDLGDSVWDSAVFIDRFRWTLEDGGCTGTIAFGRLYLPLIER